MVARRSAVALAALLVAAIAYGAWRSSAPAATIAHRPAPPVDWSALPHATITANPQRGELALELPPVDLPGGSVREQPASLGEFPLNGSIYAFHAEVVDASGRQLPIGLLHHMNVMDPSERELFLPISRRILASGTETGEVRFPSLLFGARFREGQRILANAMLHNPTAAEYRGVRVRLVVNYVPDNRPWPLFAILPWQLDVAFPVGDKSFDLPPGRSERSFEGSPAVEGRLIVIGGHMHEYGRTIELWDVTTGKMLWHGQPAPAPPGKPKAVPLSKLYSFTGLGMRIIPAHRYRVRVIYENPTGRTIAGGGMGVIGGLFMPDRDAVWPTTDPSDSLYQQDLRHFLGVSPAPVRAHLHAGH